MKRQGKPKGKLGLRRDTLRKLSSGELSMVAGGTTRLWDVVAQTTDVTCPNDSCQISCPLNTGCKMQLE